jgi:hypothetical protein
MWDMTAISLIVATTAPIQPAGLVSGGGQSSAGFAIPAGMALDAMQETRARLDRRRFHGRPMQHQRITIGSGQCGTLGHERRKSR